MEEEGELTEDSITYARIYANLVANYRLDSDDNGCRYNQVDPSHDGTCKPMAPTVI
jgi:hypothetical protein